MLITRLRLKNGYKRFHDLTIDLGETPARFVASVGPTASGKSSVLDGLLYHANAYGRIGQSEAREQSYHSMVGGGGPPSWQDIEIQFTTGDFKQVRKSKDATGNRGTIFSFRSAYRYHTPLRISDVRAVSDLKSNASGASDTSSLDARMEDNYRRLHACYHRCRDENDLRPSEARAKSSESWMRQYRGKSV